MSEQIRESFESTIEKSSFRNIYNRIPKFLRRSPDAIEAYRIPISKARMEAIYDGIYAVAMTLMVMELRMPELADPHSTSEFFKAIAQSAPSFGNYFVVFGFLGALWYKHNKQIRHITHISNSLVFFHFIELAMVALMPFCISTYIRHPDNMGVYWVTITAFLIITGAQAASWFFAKRNGAISNELAPRHYKAMHKENLKAFVVLTSVFLFTIFFRKEQPKPAPKPTINSAVIVQ